jgi:hypothetical protein
MLLFEATFSLIVSGLLSMVLPLRKFEGLASIPGRRQELPYQSRLMIMQYICKVIRNCPPNFPWHVTGLQRALAAQSMLRRRGIASVLHVPGTCDDDGPAAHVWLRDPELDGLSGELPRILG